MQVIDLLRFAAALGVVMYHMTYGPLFPGRGGSVAPEFVQGFTRYGYLGVELFFMISGFVILWSAAGRSPAAFAASRIARLGPSLWAGIAVTGAVLAVSGRDLSVLSARTILANLVLVNGVLGLPYIDGVYWTLIPEIKFYLLVLLLIAFRQMGRADYWLAAWLAGLAVCYLPFGPEWARSIVIFPYGSYFVSGSLFYLMWRDGVSVHRATCAGIALALNILCVMQVGPTFMADDRSPAALASTAGIVVLFHALFAAIALHKAKLPLSAGWFTLGSLTYPLYLLHNQIGKAVAVSAAGRVGCAGATVLGILVPLLLAFLFAQTTEKKVCPWLRNLLSEKIRALAIRFDMLRRTEA